MGDVERVWRCPAPGCEHVTTAASDSDEWRVARSQHLKQVHPTWCIAPCPRKCKHGCPCCVAAGLLEDTMDTIEVQRQYDLAPRGSAEVVAPSMIESSDAVASCSLGATAPPRKRWKRCGLSMESPSREHWQDPLGKQDGG